VADNDTTITVRVDDQGATSFFDTLGNKLDATRTVTDEASSSINLFGKNITDLKSAFSLVANAARNFIGILEEGSRIDDIEASFDGLAQAAGASGDAILTKLNSALSNTIPNVDLMKNANELLLGGIDPSKFELIAKAARQFGEVTGGSAKDGMEALTNSLLRGNDKALKTLGIVVDNKKALDDFAASIGTTADQLNEAGKVEAIRTANLKALEEQSSKLAEVTDDAGDRVAQLTTAYENEWGQIQKNIATNESLLTLLGDLIKATSTFTNVVLDSIKALQGQDIEFNRGIQVIKQVTIELLKGANAQQAYALAITKTMQAEQEHNNVLNIAKKGLLGMEAGLEDVKQETKKTGEEVDKNTKNFIEQNNALKEAKKKSDELADSQKDLALQIQKLSGTGGLSELTKRIGAVVEQFEAGNISGEDLAKALTSMQSEIVKTTDDAKIFAAALSDGQKAGEAWFKEGQEDIELYQKALKEAAESGRSVVDVLVNPDNIGGEDIGESIGEQIAAGVSNGIMTILDGDIKSGFKSIAGDLGSLGGSKLGEAIGGPIGSQIGAQLGQVIGEKLVDGIASFFGSDSAATKARKEIDKFFADAFDANRLLVIIDGQLQAIKDLDLGGSEFGNAGAGFFDALKNLSPEAQSAFNGVALGFSGLLDQGTEFATNLAAALTNNVGGSLNNLQLLVQASGKSFEELRGTVVEAFLDGQLSALEAQTALQGIQNLAEDGIPGALGAAGEAFENLIASSAKGGRASTDALRDIGAEAKELGLKTIPQLISYLVNTAGKSSESVQQVMAALATYGIDSIDEISKATDEQLIPVLANLQANGFNFAAATDSVNDLTTQLEKLPSSKDVQINIKVNTTKEGQEALKNAVAVQGSSSGGRQFFGNANQ